MRTRSVIALSAGFSALGAILGTAATLALRNDPEAVPRVDLSSVRVVEDPDRASATTLAPETRDQTSVPNRAQAETTSTSFPRTPDADPAGVPSSPPSRDRATRDPSLEGRDFAATRLGIATVPPESPTVTITDPATRPAVVPGLELRRGTVEYRGDEFRLDGRELDLGPDWWMAATAAGGDLDGDGTVGTWRQEMTGVSGREVVVLGEVDDGDIDVFEIDGVSLRPLYSEVAPWSDDWTAARLSDELTRVMATGLTADEAVRIALDAIPGIAIDVQIDINDARPYWEVDVRSVDGAVYDVEMDALTGTIVEIDRS